MPVIISLHADAHESAWRWQWMSARGRSDSFCGAVSAALRHAVASYVAVRDELGPDDKWSVEGDERDDATMEHALTAILASLAIPATLERQADGEYVWCWSGRTGQAASFEVAVATVLGCVMSAYVAARRRLLEPDAARHDRK
jgi:hypothetical protein